MVPVAVKPVDSGCAETFEQLPEFERAGQYGSGLEFWGDFPLMLRTLLPALLILLSGSLPAKAAEVSVFAASSLTEALTEVVRNYEQQHPEDRVLLTFAGSQTLAMQIEQGAPADLFISANRTVMNRLQNSALVSDVQPLVGNRLALAVRADLRPPLKSIADLTRPDLFLVIGNPQVPIGRYTRQLFTRLANDAAYGPELVTRIKQNIVSEESRVKAIVAKLLLGEADAGFIYLSDITSDKLSAVLLPGKLNPQAIYPLAKVRDGIVEIDRFYSFLQNSVAADIFRYHGFLTGGQL